MNKKILLLSMIFLALFVTAPVYAETKVLLDGQALIFDVPPVVEEGRTLVPVRLIFESLGAEVSFDATNNMVTATKGETIIKLKIGGDASKNGQPVSLDVPAKIFAQRTMVPIRFISESLGALVNYNATSQTVIITSSEGNSTSPLATLEPENIFLLANPAVFSLEVYDEYGNYLGHGSGFLIDSTGKAVTNNHVIDDAYSAKAVFFDGREVTINKILYTDEDSDAAIIQLDGKQYSYLRMGDSATISTGQKVLAIGNPLGLNNTISDGIISSAKRELEGTSYIQITAPISPGSSGGALLNYKGEAIGITTAYSPDGQNLNFAVPINEIKTKLSSTENSRDLRSYQKIVKDLVYENQYSAVIYPSNWFKEEVRMTAEISTMLFLKADNRTSNILFTREGSLNIPLPDFVKLTVAAFKDSPLLPYDTFEVTSPNEPVQINNQTFYKIRITGYIDGAKIEQLAYLTQKNSAIYMLVFSAASEDFAQDLPVLEKMVNTLSLK